MEGKLTAIIVGVLLTLAAIMFLLIEIAERSN